ncbi:ribonuclease HII [bacterium]|nr:ribonuclease HII [bacterium]
MYPPINLEIEARAKGFQNVAGGDEAGRGSWAGPVCASFVILPESFSLQGLDDSKKVKRSIRQKLFDQIISVAVSFGIGFSSEKEIDQINILEATRLAFIRAFESLFPKPDYLLLDYIRIPALSAPFSSHVQGEQKSASIAAASILAKESRDRVMEEMDLRFPGYGFSCHKGYGTRKHRIALKRYGPCDIHRKSFKPIQNILQPSLFGEQPS